jgi:hypothetical protein
MNARTVVVLAVRVELVVGMLGVVRELVLLLMLLVVRMARVMLYDVVLRHLLRLLLLLHRLLLLRSHPLLLHRLLLRHLLLMLGMRMMLMLVLLLMEMLLLLLLRRGLHLGRQLRGHGIPRRAALYAVAVAQAQDRIVGRSHHQMGRRSG